MSKEIKSSERIHPQVFRDGWALTNWETASVLQLSERTIVAYCASAGSTSKRNPSVSVERLAYHQHQSWLKEGRIPDHPDVFRAVGVCVQNR
jgi:hypothetical protein